MAITLNLKRSSPQVARLAEAAPKKHIFDQNYIQPSLATVPVEHRHSRHFPLATTATFTLARAPRFRHSRSQVTAKVPFSQPRKPGTSPSKSSRNVAHHKPNTLRHQNAPPTYSIPSKQTPKHRPACPVLIWRQLVSSPCLKTPHHR